MASESIFEFTQSLSWGAPRIAPKHSLQPIHTYRLLMCCYEHTQMRIQTEYISFKNRSMICSSYDFQSHCQDSQRRCWISQTSLQWLEALPGLLTALQGASRVVIGASRLVSALPDLFPVLPSTLLVLPDTPRIVFGTSRCYPGCHLTVYVHLDFWPVLPGVPEGHCISPVHSEIWPPWDPGLRTSRHSQRLS